MVTRKNSNTNDGNESEAELNTRQLVTQQNKKKKKSGGFQSMGLSHAVYKGIIRKGYKVPTPIQRKCVPVIMEGKDVVAMARTGSGKTAAFLIPMFERLQVRSAAVGARCLIMSPTRELAIQTLKFTKELGKFTSLKAVAVLGGDRIEDQFAAIHENPDIIIATPGRFLHVMMEMDLKLSEIEYVVFDEADRLFELGFQEQLREVIHRLPDTRQTLLFSATLPKQLVDFAKAGLNDPILIRLDVDNKLSDNLKLAFVGCRTEEKIAVLLHLLKCIVKPGELTVIFVATKHHIEYLLMVLENAGISCTYIYSSLDQYARKANVLKFQRKEVTAMLVTDIAARGIDIPLLDNVINFHFPAKSKLFVHRVGRVARAGRFGTAYSVISSDELPYLLDLHLFLGRPMQYSSSEDDQSDWNGIYGIAPQNIIDENQESLQRWLENSVDLVNLKRVCNNAYKQYIKCRPLPSSESIRRMKSDSNLSTNRINPLFGVYDSVLDEQRSKILESMKTYKPHTTIFEVNSTSKNPATSIMKTVRTLHSNAIQKHQEKRHEMLASQKGCNKSNYLAEVVETANQKAIEDTFSEVMTNKKRQSNAPFRVKKKRKMAENVDFKDKEYYLPYKSSDHHSEQGLGLDKPSFVQQATGAVLDFTGDDVKDLNKHRKQMKWDRKKKKFVQEGGNDKTVKKIKTESGVWISASYKSDLYKQWQKKSKASQALDSDEEGSDDEEKSRSQLQIPKRWRNNKKGQQPGKGAHKRELKTNEEILKARRVKAKKRYQDKKRRDGRSKRKTFRKGKRF